MGILDYRNPRDEKAEKDKPHRLQEIAVAAVIVIALIIMLVGMSLIRHWQPN